MSSLKVNQIKARLRSLFEPHLDVSDIPKNDSERDQKILSRCLAAFGIYAIAACSPEEAAASVWDGSGDNGIDAAYFDQSDLCVIFIQAKWINKGSGEPEAKELGPFINGVKDAIEQNQENFGSRLQNRLADILVRINTPGTSIHLALVTTGASSLAKPGQAVINKLLAELNGDDPDVIASSEVMGLSEVYSRTRERSTSRELNARRPDSRLVTRELSTRSLLWFDRWIAIEDMVEKARERSSGRQHPAIVGRHRSEQRN